MSTKTSRNSLHKSFRSNQLFSKYFAFRQNAYRDASKDILITYWCNRNFQAFLKTHVLQGTICMGKQISFRLFKIQQTPLLLSHFAEEECFNILGYFIRSLLCAIGQSDRNFRSHENSEILQILWWTVLRIPIIK